MKSKWSQNGPRGGKRAERAQRRGRSMPTSVSGALGSALMQFGVPQGVGGRLAGSDYPRANLPFPRCSVLFSGPMPPKPRFQQQFPKTAFCGALEEASASSELGCAGLGLIRRYALHVRGSGAADPSRFAKTAAPLERSKGNAKREERREQR